MRLSARCSSPSATKYGPILRRARGYTHCGSGAVKSFFWRWQKRLPSPLTRDDLRAGYVYELAFRQFDVSDTRVIVRRRDARFSNNSSATTSTWADRSRCR